jgi:hypothetical protein
MVRALRGEATAPQAISKTWIESSKGVVEG